MDSRCIHEACHSHREERTVLSLENPIETKTGIEGKLTGVISHFDE